MSQSSNDRIETKRLYVGYAEILKDKSKIGITGGTFEGRWADHNRGKPDELDIRESFSICLPKTAAENIENHIKANYTSRDEGEWVPWPHERLRTMVIGLIFEMCKEARKDLGRAIAGRKQRDFVCDDNRPSTKEKRKAEGRCVDCGMERDDPNLRTRCSSCNEKIRQANKARRLANQESDSSPSTEGEPPPSCNANPF